MKKLISISLFIVMMITVFNCKKSTAVQDAVTVEQISKRELHPVLDSAANMAQLSKRSYIHYPELDSSLSNAALRGVRNNIYYTGTYNDANFDSVYHSVSTTFVVPTGNWGGGNADDKSAWCAIYGRPYYNANGYYIRPWCQLGVFWNRTYGSGFFFQTWYLAANGGLSQQVVLPHRLLVDNFKLMPGELVRFEFVNIPGSTWWQIKCNGIAVYEIDFGCESGIKIELMTELQAPKITNMPEIVFDPALEYQNSNREWTCLNTMMSRQAAWYIAGLGYNKVVMKNGTGIWYLPLW
jgi:hypothetical protein